MRKLGFECNRKDCFGNRRFMDECFCGVLNAPPKSGIKRCPFFKDADKHHKRTQELLDSGRLHPVDWRGEKE